MKKNLLKVIALAALFSYSYGSSKSDYRYIVKNINGETIDKCESLDRNYSSYEFEGCESGDNLVMMGGDFRFKDTSDDTSRGFRESPFLTTESD